MTASSSSTGRHSGNQISSQSYKIITQYGDMLVVRQVIQHQHHHNHQQQSGGQQAGSSHQEQPQQQQQQTRPVIMTFHDLGLNSELQFARFCECDEVKLMLQTFTIIHVNFIGQEFPVISQATSTSTYAGVASHQNQPSSSPGGSGFQAIPDNTLPDDFKYPNVEQMAESIVDICTQLRVRSFIGLAVGAGAHIVSSLALMRPDLVDGLFLINPVVASCSITEWLYFKMSAIASNHHTGGGNSSSGGSSAGSGHGHHQNHHHHHHHHHHSRQNVDGDSPKKQSGIRRLLHAAHIHLPHHHHNHHAGESKDTLQHQADSSGESGGVGQSTQLLATNCDEDTQSVGQASTHSSASSESFKPGARLAGGSSSKYPHSGSRLRRLILSRNFRLGAGHHHHSSQHSGQQQPGSLSRTGSTASTSTVYRAPVPLPHEPNTAPAATQHGEGADKGEQQQQQEDQQLSSASSFNKSPEARRASSESLDDSPSSSSSSAAATSSSCCKRPPFEYLMYHHFGPASFQRYRRSSDTPILLQGVHGADDSSSDSPPRMRSSRGSGDSCSTNSGGGMDGSSSPNTTWTSARRRGTSGKRSGDRETSGSTSAGADNRSRSHDSLAPTTGRGRSGSVCMGANYLASIASDRQRHAYMQGVYRHYFCQINPHNLWLFAQSFAKRRTLNLRKDCGAAAHAAAAAAALGTSICTAFVGIGPVANSCAAGGDATRSARAKEAQAGAEASYSQSSSAPDAAPSSSGGERTTSATLPARRQTCASSSTSAAATANSRHQHQQQQQNLQQPPQALVAGTKVKRTFTCQTLIMCSSVQMHCERAFKLMSLLNPLQSTWIKTDHLLVLEERPDKVCQALRLFLQGIGYSMSTYERRLRLSSANGSASSADSNGSARSLL